MKKLMILPNLFPFCDGFIQFSSLFTIYINSEVISTHHICFIFCTFSDIDTNIKFLYFVGTKYVGFANICLWATTIPNRSPNYIGICHYVLIFFRTYGCDPGAGFLMGTLGIDQTK